MQRQRRLTIIQDNISPVAVLKHDVIESPVVKGMTCFAAQAKYKTSCKRRRCPHWITSSYNQNCVIIAAQNGPHTLQKIGQIYGLTRMRICQIEKNIFEKIRTKSS